MKSLSLTPKQKIEIKKLQHNLSTLDKSTHYESFLSKNDLVVESNKTHNLVSETSLHALINGNGVVINDKKLIKEYMKELEIHCIKISPVDGTNLIQLALVCYNKTIGKNMDTSLLLQIAKEVSDIKVMTISNTKDIKVLKAGVAKNTKGIESLKKQVDKNTKEIKSVKTEVKTIKTEVKGVKTAVAKNTREIKTIKTEVKAIKKDLADTKKKNKLK